MCMYNHKSQNTDTRRASVKHGNRIGNGNSKWKLEPELETGNGRQNVV